MFAIAGEAQRRRLVSITLVGRPAALARRVASSAPVSIGVGMNDVALRGLRLGNGLFALLDFGYESGLGRLLGDLWGGLGVINLDRVLRACQVCQLQIHRTDRHGPVLPPASFFLL